MTCLTPYSKTNLFVKAFYSETNAKGRYPDRRGYYGVGMQVGDILREIMGITGWKQAKLATAVHTYQGNISKWMSGRHSPNKDQWDQVLALIARDPRLAHLRFEADTGAVPVMGKSAQAR
jgi:hypothetical protein